MTTDVYSRPARSAIVTIVLLAAALAAFQLLLVRVSAVRLHQQFGLLLVSNGLLGVCAAGALLAVFERQWRLLPETWVQRCSLLFLISLPLCWAYLLAVPVPEQLELGSAGDTVQFLGLLVACAVPSCFGGGAIGLLIAGHARSAHSVPAAGLLGMAAACVLCPLALWQLGAGGCFLVTVVLAAAASAAAAQMDVVGRTVLMLVAAGAGFWMQGIDSDLPIPGRTGVQVTDTQRLAFGGEPVHRRWTGTSCVEVLPLAGPAEQSDAGTASGQPGARPLGEGRPDGASADPVSPAAGADGAQNGGQPKGTQPTGGQPTGAQPTGIQPRVAGPSAPTAPIGTAGLRQWWIAKDGDSGSLLTDFSARPAAAWDLLHTWRGTALHLVEGTGARVCLLGIGGGADLWAAQVSDAAHIRAIEPDPAVLEVHREVARAFSAPLLDDVRIDVVCDDTRSALMRSDERFDVIQLTSDDTWTSLRSGARVLEPSYLLTVDGSRTMLDRLTDDGILQITRLAGAPETIRLLNNLFRALPEQGRERFPTSVAVLRPADGLVTVLLRQGGFSKDDARKLRKFAHDASMEDVVLPDADLRRQVEEQHGEIQAIEQELQRIDGEIARRTEGVDDKEIERLRGERQKKLQPLPRLRSDYDIASFVQAVDKDAFAVDYAFDVTPVSDDRPYFFLFGSGPEGAAAAGQDLLAGGGGSPRFLQQQLWFAIAVVLLSLALPLLLGGGLGGGTRRGLVPFLVYFAGLGLGFVGLETAIVQKFTLLLGQPVYSTAVTLGSLFLFAGIGSVMSHSLLTWEPQRGRLVALVLFLAAGLVAFFGSTLVELCVGLNLAGRIAAVMLVTGPVGLLLGMPFAHGMRTVEQLSPGLVPWVWSVTVGAASVGTLLAVVLSVSFGFAAVMFLSGVVLLVAHFAADHLIRERTVPATVEAGGDPGEVEVAI